MTLPYSLANEIQDRYIGSIIYFGDAPIFVHDFDDSDRSGLKLRCSLVGHPKDKQLSISADDPSLRDGPFNLGYVNKLAYQYDDEIVYCAAYAVRIPARQFKQGLCSDTLRFSHPADWDFHKLLGTPTFRDMLQGKYPSLGKSLLLLKDNLVSVAFSRQLALSRSNIDGYDLSFRGKPVAWSEFGLKFRLGKSSSYLREFLTDSKVELC